MANRSRRSERRIDQVRWTGGRVTISAQGAGTVAATFLTAGSTPETILRIRGQLSCFKDGLSAPGLRSDIAVGLIVMPEGTGTTVTSSPIADDNAPWLYYSRFVIGYEEMVTDVVDIPALTMYRETIDNKAMRIVRPDREVQVVVENITIATGLSINLEIVHRTLLGAH